MYKYKHKENRYKIKAKQKYLYNRNKKRKHRERKIAENEEISTPKSMYLHERNTQALLKLEVTQRAV